MEQKHLSLNKDFGQGWYGGHSRELQVVLQKKCLLADYSQHSLRLEKGFVFKSSKSQTSMQSFGVSCVIEIGYQFNYRYFG